MREDGSRGGGGGGRGKTSTGILGTEKQKPEHLGAQSVEQISRLRSGFRWQSRLQNMALMGQLNRRNKACKRGQRWEVVVGHETRRMQKLEMLMKFQGR